MKRKIAFFLTVIILCAAMLPVQVFAEKDKVLEGIVAKVKQMFSIPSSFSFSPEVYSDNGKKVWTLNWDSKDGNERGISVRVDEKGTILSYDNWKSHDYSKRKLPKVSRQEARTKAEAFIKKVNPSVLSNIKLMDNNNSSMDNAYYFNYIRVINKIPFYDNTISINVDQETGEVQSYNYNWSDGLVFPDAAKAVTLDAAKKAYAEKLGLKLIYRYNYEDEKLNLYAAYTPKYGDSYVIDALTGDKIQLDQAFYGGRGGNENAKLADSMTDKAGIILTPEEQKAIENVSDMISQEAAEKIVRDCASVNLTSDYKLMNANLSRNWPLRDEYVWYLYFDKDSKKTDGSDYGYISATINAKTGEITRFDRSTRYSDSDKAKYTEAQSRQAVEDFLKGFTPDKFKNTEYDDSSIDRYPYMKSTEEQKYFSFDYCRKVNGAYFPDNKISVGFDAVTGEVNSFSVNWFNVDFPAVNKVMEVGKALDKLFSQIGLELQYKANYPEEYYKKGIMPQNSKLEIKLAYSLKSDIPQYLDASTGAVLNYDGKPYKENKPVVYTDIKGHRSEKQIVVLSEFGISLEGPKFRPDESITQLDFLILISKTLSNYYGPVIPSNSSKADIESLYKSKADIESLYKELIREGIIKEGEKKPTSVVNKEEAVKFIIRVMKYDKVADIKGIYKCSFKDADKIDASLIGYVAIAQGLKIIGSSGNFSPKAKLTRAQAAVMIYNYLQG